MTDKDTLTEKEHEALIQEMVRDAKIADVPSGLKDNPVIHRGNEELNAPMVVKELSSAGYVYVWDTRTYDKIPVLYYMLAKKLKQRRPDGSYRFTTIDPKKLPTRGTIKCLLHSDDENREKYNGFGFPVCNKNNISSPYQLQQHMKKKHPQEWATIKEEKERKEKEEDREFQRAVLSQQKAPLYVSNKDKAK